MFTLVADGFISITYNNNNNNNLNYSIIDKIY